VESEAIFWAEEGGILKTSVKVARDAGLDVHTPWPGCPGALDQAAAQSAALAGGGAEHQAEGEGGLGLSLDEQARQVGTPTAQAGAVVASTS